MLHLIVAGCITAISLLAAIIIRLSRKKVPIAWRIEGNKEIPIEWDVNDRIKKILDRTLKSLIEAEKKKQHRLKKIDKQLAKLRNRYQIVEINL